MIRTVWLQVFEYIATHRQEFLGEVLFHLRLVLVPVGLAVLVAVPLGIAITRVRWLEGPVISIANACQTVPSLALLALLIPLLGIGERPAAAAIFVYALLPILRNTHAGIRGVDASLRKAARGMGLTPLQLLLMVELPLAFRVIMAGIRTTVVIGVGVATIAPLIGARGLGRYIIHGLSLLREELILVGAIPAALMAVLADWLLGRLEDRLTPRGLKI